MASPYTLTTQYIVLFSHRTVQLPICDKEVQTYNIVHYTMGCVHYTYISAHILQKYITQASSSRTSITKQQVALVC